MDNISLVHLYKHLHQDYVVLNGILKKKSKKKKKWSKSINF